MSVQLTMYILFVWIPELVCFRINVWRWRKGYFRPRQTVKSIVILYVEME